MLDAHPQVKIPVEFPVFPLLISRFGRVNRWDQPRLLEFVDFLYTRGMGKLRSFNQLAPDREAFTRHILNLSPPITLPDVLQSVNLYSVSQFPKGEIRAVADKNPLYSIFIHRFMKQFPDAGFICLVRDYRDNFVSLKQMGDKNRIEAPNLVLQVSRWSYIVRRFLKYRERYPERFLIVRYEDLVASPRETFRQITGFMNIPESEMVFDDRARREAVSHTYSDSSLSTYHASLMQPIHQGRIGIYREKLSSEEIRLADQIAGKSAGLLGYAREAHPWSFRIFLRSLPMNVYGNLLFLAIRLGSRFPYPIVSWMSRRLTALVTVYKRIRKTG